MPSRPGEGVDVAFRMIVDGMEAQLPQSKVLCTGITYDDSDHTVAESRNMMEDRLDIVDEFAGDNPDKAKEYVDFVSRSLREKRHPEQSTKSTNRRINRFRRSALSIIKDQTEEV